MQGVRETILAFALAMLITYIFFYEMPVRSREDVYIQHHSGDVTCRDNPELCKNVDIILKQEEKGLR